MIELSATDYFGKILEKFKWFLLRLFDLNGNGVIESTEILVAIDMFKEHSIEEKVNGFEKLQFLIFKTYQ